MCLPESAHFGIRFCIFFPTSTMAASLSDSSMASEAEGQPTPSETLQAGRQMIIRLAVSIPCKHSPY